MIKFSIVIPLYNKEKEIQDTLNSVLKQSFRNFEIIIVNDGSTDGSSEIVKKIKDDRIILFHKKNEGVSIARNYGIEKVNSNFIAFLDADDYWHPSHLENLNNLILKFPNQLWFSSAYEKRFNNNFSTPMNAPILKKGDNWNGIISNYFENSLIDCLAWTSAVCMKKEFLNSLNGFDIKITHGAGEDTDLWLRAALKSDLAFSTTVTARHNLDSNNRISNTPALKRNYMDLDKYEKNSINNIFLKKYLDLNRYSFALQYKMSKDFNTYKNYTKKINLNNLNTKQRFLLKLPRIVLLLLINIKSFFERIGFRLSSF